MLGTARPSGLPQRRGAFDCMELGVHALKGVAVPMRVYGVHGESLAERNGLQEESEP